MADMKPVTISEAARVTCLLYGRHVYPRIGLPGHLTTWKLWVGNGGTGMTTLMRQESSAKEVMYRAVGDSTVHL